MKNFFWFLSFCVLSITGYCQPTHIPLFPKGAPGALPAPAHYHEEVDSNGYAYRVTQPELIAFLPEKGKATGTSVIICPGGGYQLIVTSDEGTDVARKFAQFGIAAFVLKYRIPNDTVMKNKSMAPLQDAQQAMLTVRENAREWNLNPQRVGIVGLSAGGHVASTAGTHFDTTLVVNTHHSSLRPDFMVLVYPVITMNTEWGAPRSRGNLLGSHPSTSAINFFSSELHVTPSTPPTFLLHASDDKRITVRNSLVFYEALRKAGVKAEMHLLQDGGHGFGIDHPTRKDEWIKLCVDWMRINGF
ncbi:MAG: alpha/beta hydrolase [Bacteroidetes bacterium]|nr:alpha/beta hydrolase [Bacteroidota bacterium]